MKKLFSLLIIIVTIAFVFLFISSCENSNQITSPKQQSSGNINQQLDDLEKNVAELSQSVSSSSVSSQNTDGDGGRDPQYCGNDDFPTFTYTGTMSYNECAWSPEQWPEAEFIAILWANYAPRFTDLDFRACGKEQYPEIPSITGLSKSQQNNHPHFTWNFRHSHYYIIQRSIGNNNNWVDIGTNNNCWYGDYPNVDCGTNESLRFTDWGINLSTITQNVYYRVSVQIFSSFSQGDPQIVYTPSLTVNITGPNNLLSGQAGTFTANVSGGVPPYSYSWKKYQYCNDRSQSDDSKKDDSTRSVPCGSWKSISGNTATVYVSGSYPAFLLKVTVTAQNGSDVDYHFVDVTLP